jgi:uncharacterized membrane protein YphA (DoxX/SURF4 family)
LVGHRNLLVVDEVSTVPRRPPAQIGRLPGGAGKFSRISSRMLGTAGSAGLCLLGFLGLLDQLALEHDVDLVADDEPSVPEPITDSGPFHPNTEVSLTGPTIFSLPGVPMRLRNLPTRVATGAYILHTGWEKWHANEQRATGVHAVAAGAFPAFDQMKPTDFLKLLSAGEMAVGAALLAPVVPPVIAGAALTGFSGALLTMYLRTDGMRKPGSIWPTQQGTAVSKDVWMLGIGLGLVIDGIQRRNHG